MSHTLAIPRTVEPARRILFGVLLAEASLVGLGLLLGHPLLAAAAAAAVAYFFLAFRSPDLAWALVWVAVSFDVERLVGGGIAVTVPTEPMILLALVAWLLRSLIRGRWTLPASPLHLPLAVLAGWALLSTVWSVRPVATLKAWIMIGGYATFGYLYCFQERSDRRWCRWWLPVVALTGLVWGVFGVARVLLTGSALQAATIASTYSYGAFRPFFSEHGTYSAYLGMLLPAALLGALERPGWWRYLYAASAVCIGSGIVLAFARAGWLAILVVVPATVVGWAAWRRSHGRLLLPAVITLAVALLVAGVGVSRQITRHVESVVSTGNVSNLERLSRWTAAIAMTKDHPATGVGFGGYVDAYPSYKRRAILTEQGFIRMGVHSEPLKLLSELGIPGFLAAVWLLAAVFLLGVRVFRRLPDPDDRLLALAAMAGLATYVLNGIFNAYLVETKVTVPFWAAIGIIGALGRRLEEPAEIR